MRNDVIDALAHVNPVPLDTAPTLDLELAFRQAQKRGGSARRLAKPPTRFPHARAILLTMLAGLIAIASALAFGSPTIDFLSAKKAPKWEFVGFARQAKLRAFLTGQLPGNGMKLTAAAREITTITFDGHEHTLVVAPLENGGICRSWSGPFIGSTCGPIDRTKPLKFGLSGNASGPIAVNGIVLDRQATQLRIRFQDGASEQIPVVWVSAPIDAGFFLHPIAPTHRHPGHYPAELLLLNSDGKTVASVNLPHGAPSRQQRVDLPGFGRMAIPPQAEFARRRLLFQIAAAIPTRTGAPRSRRLGLWAAPARGGGTCIWTNGSGPVGCGHPARYATLLPIAPNFYTDTLCCQVRTDVARVELRFQDGARIELHPRNGYLLAAIPLAHYAIGHRLTEEAAYDSAGHLLGTRKISPGPGRYPCARPSVRIDGLTLCR